MRRVPRQFDPRRWNSLANINSAWWHWNVNVLAASPAVSRDRRRALMERAGFDFGGTAIVESGCFFFSNRIRFGPWSIINDHCYLDTRDEIFLDEQAGLSAGCMVLTSTHPIVDSRVQRRGRFQTAPVYIGPGTWIGARVTILPGVSIGQACVVAAGAVVTKDLDDDGLYAGIPARRVRDLDPGESAARPAV